MAASASSNLPGGLARWWRHQWVTPRHVASKLGADALARIEQAVAASEATHLGEVRVCVEAALPQSYLWRGATARERALTLFGKLRVWDTEHNAGVLIYLLWADHAIEIVADRGVARLVPQQRWQVQVDALRAALVAGRYEDGLLAAVHGVDALLREVLPAQAAASPRHNDLSNAPDLR